VFQQILANLFAFYSPPDFSLHRNRIGVVLVGQPARKFPHVGLAFRLNPLIEVFRKKQRIVLEVFLSLCSLLSIRTKYASCFVFAVMFHNSFKNPFDI
jgi:hypothetical protein